MVRTVAALVAAAALGGSARGARADEASTLAREYVDAIYGDFAASARKVRKVDGSDHAYVPRPEFTVLRRGHLRESLQLSFEAGGERVRIAGHRKAGHPWVHLDRGQLEQYIATRLREGWNLPDADLGDRGTLESARALMIDALHAWRPTRLPRTARTQVRPPRRAARASRQRASGR